MTDATDQQLADLMAKIDPAQLERLEAELRDSRNRIEDKLRDLGWSEAAVDAFMAAYGKMMKVAACCALLRLPCPEVKFFPPLN